MKHTFTIHIKPFSVNNAYFKNRQLNTQARAWRADFLLQLQDLTLQEFFVDFQRTWLPSKHCIDVTYDFKIPKSHLFTAKGEISARSFDLTNIEKLAQDNIFDKRFNGRMLRNATTKLMEPIANLCIDDKFVTSLHSIKSLSSDSEWSIEITIVRRDLSDVYASLFCPLTGDFLS